MKTLTKTSHIQTVKMQNLSNEQQVQKLLNWTELQYCQFKFDGGMAYAKRMTYNDAIGFDFLIKTRFFWQFWKNEWAKRDAEFLLLYSAEAGAALLHDQYLFQHNVYRLHDDNLMARISTSMVGYALDEYMADFKQEAK